MLLDNKVEVNVGHQNYKHYENLGYVIKKDVDKRGRPTTPNQVVVVDINDIPDSSKALIPLRCDFCGRTFYQQKLNYTNAHKNSEYDCCDRSDCRSKKSQLSKFKKYGTLNPAEIAMQTNGKVGRNPKFTKDDLFEIAEYKNYSIISKLSDHLIVKDRIDLRCNKHNIDFNTSIECFMDIKVNNCPECARERASEVKRNCSIEDARKIATERNYTLLTDFISNCDDKILYICNLHPDYGVQSTSLYGMQHSTHNCKLCRQPRGENHPNWQGGISDDKWRDSGSYEYKSWRKAVYERDNYTCQCCGSKSKKINAHHIKNYATNPDLRYDVTNGITLCEECHLNNYPNGFHKLYSNCNNTKEQLQEYLDMRRKELKLPFISIDSIINKSKD